MSVAAAGPLLALAVTGSPVVAGCVTAASVLPGLLLHVPAGLLVDRFDRRTVMWVSQAVRIAFAVVTCLSLWLCDSVTILFVAALIDGSCTVFYEVAEIAAVPDLVPKASLNAAIGSNEAKLNASMLLGRPLGGALLGVNSVMPWIVTACTSLFPMVALFFTRVTGPEKGRSGHRDHAADAPAAEGGAGPAARVAGGRPPADLSLRGALSRLAHDFFSCAVLAVCVLANFLFQVIVLLQIFLADREGMPTYLVGLMLSCSGLGGFVGAVVSPWLLGRRPPSASVLPCVLLWVPMVWAATLPADPMIGLAMWGLCSVVGAHINVALRAHQVKIFPNGQLGRIIGVTRFLSVGSVALGAFSGGWIIRFLGVSGTGVLVSAMFTGVAVVLVMALHVNGVRSIPLGVRWKARRPARIPLALPASSGSAGEQEGRGRTAPNCSAPAGRG